jgi:hypothetical protein
MGKLLLGIVGGGVAGFLVSRYLLPPGVTIPCGNQSIAIAPSGIATLPSGTQVPLTLICDAASHILPVVT